MIPAHNEAASIVATVRDIAKTLEAERIEYEIVVVDDASSDGTGAVLERLGQENPNVRGIRSQYPHGFGFAVRTGLGAFTGDAVAIVMADGSDNPADLVRYHRLLEQGYDCVFGSRFMPGSSVHRYPKFKLILNRVFNFGIRILFRHRYNDTTNAFKAYRREVIEGCQPLLSNHFNLTVELPLKAITRRYSYAVIPISWTNRATGSSKLSLEEMGSRYLFIVLYVFLEFHLSHGDYKRRDFKGATPRPRPHRGLLRVLPRLSPLSPGRPPQEDEEQRPTAGGPTRRW